MISCGIRVSIATMRGPPRNACSWVGLEARAMDWASDDAACGLISILAATLCKMADAQSLTCSSSPPNCAASVLNAIQLATSAISFGCWGAFPIRQCLAEDFVDGPAIGVSEMVEFACFVLPV